MDVDSNSTQDENPKNESLTIPQKNNELEKADETHTSASHKIKSLPDRLIRGLINVVVHFNTK